MAHLLIEDVNGKLQKYEVGAATTTIGRSPDNIIVLGDASVSSRHAEIRGDSGRYSVHDLGSSNGTKLNDARIQASELNNGDILSFGAVEATFTARAKDQQRRTAQEPSPFMQSLPSEGKNGKLGGGSIFACLLWMGVLCKMQTLLKKLQTVDLRNADVKTGIAAVERGVLEERYRNFVEQVAKIDSALKALEETPSQGASTSIKEQAQNVFKAGKRKTQETLLLLHRKRVLSDLGSEVRKSKPSHELLAPEVSAACAIAQRTGALEENIISLQRKMPVLLRRPLWIAGAIGLLLFYLMLSPMVQAWRENSAAENSREQIYAQGEKNLADAIASSKALRVETDKTLAKLKDDQTTAAIAWREKEADEKRAEMALNEAQLRDEALIREKNAQRQMEDEANREVTRLQRAKQEASVIAMKEAAEFQNKAETKKLEKEKSQKEEQLTLFAERLFRSISLSPSTILAPSLQQLKSTVSVAGKDITQIRSFYGNSDWRGLTQFLNSGSRDFSENEISTAVRELLNKSFSVVIRTSYLSSAKQEIHFASFAGSSSWEFMDAKLDSSVGPAVAKGVRYWVGLNPVQRGQGKQHPDKIGYVFPWRPRMTTVFFAVGDGQTGEKFSSFQSDFNHEQIRMEDKNKLGELSDADWLQAFRVAEMTLLERTATWVSGQSRAAGDDPKIISIARRKEGKWVAVGAGLITIEKKPCNVTSILSFNKELYVSTLPTSKAYLTRPGKESQLMRWTGTDWFTVDGISKDGWIRAMEVFDGRLYIAGYFKIEGTNIEDFASWNGHSWEAVPNWKQSDLVSSLEASGGALFVGGHGFLKILSTSGLTDLFASPFPPTVYALTFLGNKLTIAGNPIDSGTGNGLFLYENKQWTPLLPGVDTRTAKLMTKNDMLYFYSRGEVRIYSASTHEWNTIPHPSSVTCMAFLGNTLLLGTNSELFAFNGVQSENLGIEVKNLEAIYVDGQDVYIGGSFKHIHRSDGSPL